MGYKQDLERILEKEKKGKKIKTGKAGGIAVAGQAALVGTKIAAATSTAAAGGTVTGTTLAAGMSSVAAGTAVAAPPFSTIIAVIPLAIAGISLGVMAKKNRQKKLIGKDASLLKKFRKRYSKLSRSKRKKKAISLLKKYRNLLKSGNKKTLSPFDGNKRKKHKISWRAAKAKLELKMNALYAAQFGKSYRKRAKKKVTKKQAKAEKAVVNDIKTLQKESIDPRTSNFPLLAGGLVGITPKLVAAQLGDPTSDVDLVKRQQMMDGKRPKEALNIPNPELMALKVEAESRPELARIEKAQNPKSNMLLYGVIATSVVGLGGTLLYLRSKPSESPVDTVPDLQH